MGKRGPKPYDAEKLKEAFWAKVRKCGSGRCWLWQAATAHGGYGVMRVRGKTVNASRLSLEFYLGRKLRPGMCALHDCPGGDNPACVNPDHLWEGTKSQNSRDMVRKGRGHPPRLAGERHGNAKLSDARVLQIRRQYAARKKTQTQLADEHGVSQHLISLIVRRLAWKHL